LVPVHDPVAPVVRLRLVHQGPARLRPVPPHRDHGRRLVPREPPPLPEPRRLLPQAFHPRAPPGATWAPPPDGPSPRGPARPARRSAPAPRSAAPPSVRPPSPPPVGRQSTS